MAEEQQFFSREAKMFKIQLDNIANDFQNLPRFSPKLYDPLVNFLRVLEVPLENYTPFLLTIEILFTKLLKRGDLVEDIVPLKPIDESPEAEYTRWLRQCYEMALSRTLELIKHGRTNSRLQALVTACKLLQAEGKHPLEPTQGYYFPSVRLKNIFTVLLDSDVSMSPVILRFQEFTEYRDVQQYGLKVLAAIAYRKSPSTTYMLNFLELLEKLLLTEIATEPKGKIKDKEDYEEDNWKLLCSTDGGKRFPYSQASCRRYANRCWGFACQWPLYAEARTHRRALLLLVERVLPLLSRPHLATDMLCDSLDAGGAISMVALQGVLELVRRHNVDYPDIYDRLYAMYEPEMFVTRHKDRLMKLTDIFLSSTHLPESLVAAFAKRLSRLALVASCEDATRLLQLVGNMLQRHPGLKRMVCAEESHAVMSSDSYVMEETSAARSRALGGSLWEVAALRRHSHRGVSAAAAQVLSAAHARAPLNIVALNDDALFEEELQRRFNSIEVNFIRPSLAIQQPNNRFTSFWKPI